MTLRHESGRSPQRQERHDQPRWSSSHMETGPLSRIRQCDPDSDTKCPDLAREKAFLLVVEFLVRQEP
jgi:hypothetical protein